MHDFESAYWLPFASRPGESPVVPPIYLNLISFLPPLAYQNSLLFTIFVKVLL